jgi:hypothetical protein
MTSAAFSASSGSPRRISLRGSASRTATETATAADEALQYVLDRRLRRREGRLPPARRHASIGNPSVLSVGSRFARPLWLTRALALGLLAILLGLATFSVGTGRNPRVVVPVAGRLLLNGRALADSVVEFHHLDGSDGRIETAVTDPHGRFDFGGASPAGVAPGEYGVVVRARRRVVRGGEVSFVHVPVPVPYRRPDTTPLKVSVSTPLPDLVLAVRP